MTMENGMLCPGLSGDLDRIHESSPELPNAFVHDGAAVLVQDGRAIAALEEERLNCVKHSNESPSNSIRYCLSTAGVELGEIDRIAFYATEACCKTMLERPVVSRPVTLDAKLLRRSCWHGSVGQRSIRLRLSFVNHHEAHAVSAFAMSGFEQSLVLAINGGGECLSGLLAVGSDTGVAQLDSRKS
ncbi:MULTISPECIES: carbamoyltransferase N-terminal domain-containing protein [Bradyrhizobium]|uniref:carbamoyltransferase N-terminal domain-containing protein n=1 Tax=Bradyrhizobium TaxID=374 RepID=UPI00055A6A38|nr:MULTISPECIES: carbamoyltransferase N-terminal domain-containing protein [Bradyrhizobium]